MARKATRKPKRRRNCKRKGPMAAWVKDSGRSLTEIAKDLDLSVQHVSNLLHGHTDPSRAVAVAIEKLTKGAVPVAAWD